MRSQPAKDVSVVGVNLKRLRVRRKLTQEQLAKTCGIHRTTIIDLESGARQVPHGPVLRALADALGVTTGRLFAEAVRR